MEQINLSIRKLEAELLPNISLREDMYLRAEIQMLKEERKKLETIANEIRVGVSQYGSYYSSNTGGF
jgi:hypothetical protein